METCTAMPNAHRNSTLETFLVEWKQIISGATAEDLEAPLKPS